MNVWADNLADRLPLSFPEDPPDTEEFEAPPGLPCDLADLAPLSRTAARAESFGDLIDSVVEMDRLLATVSAWRAELVDQARLWNEATEHAATDGPGGWTAQTVARRTLTTEIACALRVPERTADALVEESKALVHELPGTLEALRAGAISYRHGQRLIEHAVSLSADARRGFEAAVLPFAKKLTVSRFDAKARTVRERTDPTTITFRHVTAAENRELRFEPGRDGMAWLSAHLPAATALAAYDRVTGIATSLQGTAESRTLAQLRADVFGDLLIDGIACDSGQGAADRGIRPKVLVTVPVLTLLGHSEEPGILEGYGPIDPDAARRLAAHAPSFTRLLTHPETGAVLSVGRDSYAVPSDLRTWLRVRDGTCRYPGCNRAAGRCDIDHTCDWQFDGRTEHDNLAHLCPAHHGVKHNTGWAVAHAPDDANSSDGTLEWTSPSGKKYRTEPETVLRPPGETEPDPPPDG